MSRDRMGFLSGDFDYLAERLRKENADVYALVVQVSELGQKLLPRVTVLERTRQHLLAGAFFIRALQSLQGAVLMFEKGMNLEARTLIRSALETVFYLGAAAKEEDFAEDFVRDHIHRLDVLAKAHRELAIAAVEDHATLATAIDGAREIAGDGRSLPIRNAAVRAGMDAIYQGFYRGLSTDSAHPTVMSISSHFERDSDGSPVGLLWGPELNDNDRLEDTLYLIALVGILMNDTMNALVDDKVIESESHKLSRSYLRLRGHTPSEELQAEPEEA